MVPALNARHVLGAFVATAERKTIAPSIGVFMGTRRFIVLGAFLLRDRIRAASFHLALLSVAVLGALPPSYRMS